MAKSNPHMEAVQGSKGLIFKSARPGYPMGNGSPITKEAVRNTVQAWADGGITDVFILLTDGEQLFYYETLLESLYQPFVATHSFPIPDMKPMRLGMALVLVEKAYHILRGEEKRKILIHCSAGIGRTNMALGCLSQYLAYRGIFKKLFFDAPQTPQQTLVISQLKNLLASRAFGRTQKVEV